MWIMIPLAPIVIATLSIALGFFGEMSMDSQIVSIILFVVVGIVFVGIAIHNATGRIAVGQKAGSTFTCLVGGVVSSYVLRHFIATLAAIESGFLGRLAFIFVLLMGGGFAFLIVLGCIYACCWVGNEWRGR